MLLLQGMSDGLMRKVQSVQNAAACLITGTKRCNHITPVLRQLHWLPVHQRVTFKLACLAYQSLSGNAPMYLPNDIRLLSESDRRQLRSSSIRTCTVPRTHNGYDDRSFAANGPRLWNSLPSQLATFWHWLQWLQTPTENASVWIDCSTVHCDFSFMCAL